MGIVGFVFKLLVGFVFELLVGYGFKLLIQFGFKLLAYKRTSSEICKNKIPKNNIELGKENVREIVVALLQVRYSIVFVNLCLHE